MAGADYFLRAVDIYDRKVARDEQVAFRNDRANEDDRRYGVNRQDMLNGREQQQDNWQAGHQLNVAQGERAQTQLDIIVGQNEARKKWAKMLLESGVDRENLTPAAKNLIDSGAEGTTVQIGPNGNGMLMTTHKDGSVTPQKTKDGKDISIPKHLLKGAMNINASQSDEKGDAFIESFGGMKLDEKTGRFSFPNADGSQPTDPTEDNSAAGPPQGQGAMIQDGETYAEPTPQYMREPQFSQPALGTVADAQVAMDNNEQPAMLSATSGLKLQDVKDSYKPKMTNDALQVPAGQDYLNPLNPKQPTANSGSDEYKFGPKTTKFKPSLNKVPLPETPAVTETKKEPTSKVTAKQLTTPEDWDKAKGNWVASKATQTRLESVMASGGAVTEQSGLFTPAQRREMGALMIESGGSFADATNFVQTGDVNRSIYDLQQMDIDNAATYQKSIKTIDKALLTASNKQAKLYNDKLKLEKAMPADARALANDIANGIGIDKKDLKKRDRLFARIEYTIASKMLAPGMFSSITGRAVMRNAIEMQLAMERKNGSYPAKTFSIGLAMAARKITPKDLASEEGQRMIKHEVAIFNQLTGEQGGMDEAVFGAVVAFDKLGETKQKHLWANSEFRAAYKMYQDASK